SVGDDRNDLHPLGRTAGAPLGLHWGRCVDFSMSVQLMSSASHSERASSSPLARFSTKSAATHLREGSWSYRSIRRARPFSAIGTHISMGLSGSQLTCPWQMMPSFPVAASCYSPMAKQLGRRLATDRA